MNTSAPGFGIGEVASRTGVGEGTLRMWESRHGFPCPQRLPGGHRVYSTADIERIVAVVEARRGGLSLPAAIDRAEELGAEPEPSVYRALRTRFDHLPPTVMSKRALLWITRAIEDECAARAGKPLLIGCFQKEEFFRQSESRWQALSRGAGRSVVLAAFPGIRIPEDGPAEVPLAADDELTREWAVICEDEDLSACVIGRERLDSGSEPGFEVIWTVEPRVVREAARACISFVAASVPGLVDDVHTELAAPPPEPGEKHLRSAVALASRVTGYATGGTDA